MNTGIPLERDAVVAAVLHALITEQVRTPRLLSHGLAHAYLTGGADAVRAEAISRAGDDTGARISGRVIAWMEAVRTERAPLYWSVDYARDIGAEITGTTIHALESVRAQWRWALRHPSINAASVRVTEYAQTLVSVPVDPERLPADERHQPPAIPGAYRVERFYAFDGAGPRVLPDRAAARYAHQHLRETRRSSFNLPFVLRDVVSVVMTREVTDEVTGRP